MHQSMSSVMFTVAVEDILKRMNIEDGIDINGVKLNTLTFADDIIRCSESDKDMKNIL